MFFIAVNINKNLKINLSFKLASIRKWGIVKKEEIRIPSKIDMTVNPLLASLSVALERQIQDSLIIQEMYEVILLVYVSHHFCTKFKQHLLNNKISEVFKPLIIVSINPLLIK